MKNNNLTAAAAALTINTTVTAADLCTPAVIQLPPCLFAGGRCWQCKHYSGQYCYKHMSPVDPEKWSCSYFE